MTRAARQRGPGIALLLVVIWVGAAGGAGKKPPAAHKEPADPSGTTLYMNQLRSLFAAWDSDGNKFIDKLELAQAFRGRGTRPYDEKPAPAASTTTRPDYSRYPDYLALAQLDLDLDGRISRAEFMTWARAYAVQLKKLGDLQVKLLAAQQKLQTTAPGSKTFQSTQTKIAGYQASIVQLQPKIKALAQALPPKVHKTLLKPAQDK